VNVSRIGKAATTGTVSLTVVDGRKPIVTAVLLNGIQGQALVNPSDRVELFATVDTVNGPAVSSFTWFTSKGDKKIIEVASNLVTPNGAAFITIKGNVLSRGGSYWFGVNATASNGISTTSTVHVVVNNSPRFGSLTLSPSTCNNCTALSTPFTLEAAYWVDDTGNNRSYVNEG
jgi:hypothetical protein